MKSARSRACVRSINGLIVACTDDASVNDAAASIIRDPSRREQLSERSRRRGIFIRELGGLVDGLGGSSASRGSFHAGLGAFFHRLRAAAVGVHDGDEYAACSRVQSKTEAAYLTALETRLPEHVRSVLERQHVEIEHDRVDVRRLEFLR